MASGCNQNSNATPHYLQIFNPPLEPCGDFHLFARFPDDIRWLVWQHFLTHERWIDITLKPGSFTSEQREQTNHQNYEIILNYRWKISKLFRTTSESRRAALAFYRVQLPCWYQRKDKSMVNSTLYVCPELDTLMLNCLEVFENFAHDIWACDSRCVGLVNLALPVRGQTQDFNTPSITGRDTSRLKETLLRIERFTVMNTFAIRRWFGGFAKRSTVPVFRMNRAVPIMGHSFGFHRLSRDPRLNEENFKQIYLGNRDPVRRFHRWFRLLLSVGVKHNHEVEYRFGSCLRLSSPLITDRASAMDYVKKSHEKFITRMVSATDEPLDDIAEETVEHLQETPQPAIGFWLFPLRIFNRLPLADPSREYPIEHDEEGGTPIKVSSALEYGAELCLANIY
ncbi:hypothetical protein FPRO05_02142 [Fusarium proliferatum]|uniref:2EXR domain-containing protein n=1 Tax=Gibberella intermedia TaxID=948311 RepID=A0A365NA10_GIBIN|nr:hypothetical protein FPRO05_02142 [Fusarium proliferatum]